MRFLTYCKDGETQAGVLSRDGLGVFSFRSLGIPADDMLSFIAMSDRVVLADLQDKLEHNPTGAVPLAQVKLLAPIPEPKQDIVCLGVNYRDHAEEAARFKNLTPKEASHAVYFGKRVNGIAGDGGEIDGRFDIVDGLDYEVELALIIKRDAKQVPKDKVFDYIFGYTILNDISARNIQTRHGQWYLGKSLDGHCAMGPWIVSEDCFERPPVLNLRCSVNGELRQNSSTDLLIFDIPHMISELSQGMTLKAGTIVSTGTPSGVGLGFNPPKFLNAGDVVECEIEGIGRLTNRIE